MSSFLLKSIKPDPAREPDPTFGERPFWKLLLVAFVGIVIGVTAVRVTSKVKVIGERLAESRRANAAARAASLEDAARTADRERRNEERHLRRLAFEAKTVTVADLGRDPDDD